jgi:hypothetical protein
MVVLFLSPMQTLFGCSSLKFVAAGDKWLQVRDEQLRRYAGVVSEGDS